MPEPILKEARITGLPRGLHEGKVLQLKTINYLFGPNGSGKSLVLRSLSKQAKQAIRNSGQGNEGYFAQYVTASAQQQLHSESFQMLDRPASEMELDNDEISGQSFYQHLEDYPEIRIKIRDALQKYLGRYPNVIRRGVLNVMSFLREEDPDEPSYSPQHESDGLRRLSLLLTYVYHPKCLFLAIDEPELYLHPDMISFLLEEVQEEIRFGKQFAFATHSPEMIRVGKSDTYSYSYFNLKDKLKETKIIQATDTGADKVIEQLGVLLDVNKRAFLYAPVTVLVEGIQDVYVFGKMKQTAKVEWSRRVFMVDVGGKNNMFNFWILWRKLEKDCRVILDGPKEGKEPEFVTTVVDPFCTELSVDTGLAFEAKKVELKKFNVFIVDTDDVMVFGSKRLSALEDFDNIFDQLDISHHVEILNQAIRVDEEIKKVLRADEQSWLVDIAKTIHGHFFNGRDRDAALAEAEKTILSQHPTIEISRPSEPPGALLEVKFRVGRDRHLYLLVCDDVSKTTYGVRGTS